MNIARCLSANIKNLRKERDLTQAELAQRAGISLIFLQGLEGERKWLSPDTAKAIARALKVSESRLFENCFPKKNGRMSNTGKKSKPGVRKLISFQSGHMPEDIFHSLAHVCKDPQWQWDVLRWILEGYRQERL